MITRRLASGRLLSPLTTVIIALLLLTQLAILKFLPYSSSAIESVSLKDTEAVPSEAGFRLGTIHWDMPSYSIDPTLSAYRDFYQSYCEGHEGLDAAVRASDELAHRFPHGEPKKEFLYGYYDPTYELHAHKGGAPGHCVTRSGLVAAVLLSAGIPARVLQAIPPDYSGHNIIEVWDKARGWVLFDPTTGTVYGLVEDGAVSPTYLSAYAAARAEGTVIPLTLGRRASGTSPGGFFSPKFFRGALLYPEPWLYLRTGPRASTWPFRGQFAQVGDPSWEMGPARSAIHAGIVASILGLSFQVTAALLVRSKGRWPRRVTTEGA